jgi:hypothetical protein
MTVANIMKHPFRKSGANAARNLILAGVALSGLGLANTGFAAAPAPDAAVGRTDRHDWIAAGTNTDHTPRMIPEQPEAVGGGSWSCAEASSSTRNPFGSHREAW